MYIFIYCNDAISPSCRYRIISNDVTKWLCVLKAEDRTFYFIFTCNIQLFLPSFFIPPPFRFFFFPFSCKVVCLQNKFPNLSTNTGSKISCIFMCAHTFMILCVALFLCMCARVYFCMSTVHRHARAGAEGERVWNRASRMEFPNSSFQILVPMHFCNNILLSHDTFTCPLFAVSHIALRGLC